VNRSAVTSHEAHPYFPMSTLRDVYVSAIFGTRGGVRQGQSRYGIAMGCYSMQEFAVRCMGSCRVTWWRAKRVVVCSRGLGCRGLKEMTTPPASSTSASQAPLFPLFLPPCLGYVSLTLVAFALASLINRGQRDLPSLKVSWSATNGYIFIMRSVQPLSRKKKLHSTIGEPDAGRLTKGEDFRSTILEQVEKEDSCTWG
jgi:hypothetical protein